MMNILLVPSQDKKIIKLLLDAMKLQKQIIKTKQLTKADAELLVQIYDKVEHAHQLFKLQNIAHTFNLN